MTVDEKPQEISGDPDTVSSSHASDITDVIHDPVAIRREQKEPEELARTSTSLEHSGVISHTLNRVRTKDSGEEASPPPDGGFLAWSHVVLVHLVCFVVWGSVNSFGVFEEYYTNALKETPSNVSWIGGVQTFLTFFIGTFSGSCIAVFGVFMTSLCKTYWQVFLAQGLCQGLGNGIAFVPSMALLSTYFAKKRGVAIGIAASGSAVGGVVFPAIVEAVLHKIGFGWTVRIIGLIMLVFLGICAVFIRPRMIPRKRGPIVDWSSFTEPRYLLFCIAAFLLFWGVYTGYFYVTSFARSQIGVDYSTSINVLLVMNAVGVPSRIIPNLISDLYTGPINTFIISILFGSIILYIWIAIDSVSSLWAFAVLYGIAGATAQGLLPVTLTSLTQDPSKAGVRMGMCFSVMAVAVLTGPSISGALIGRDGGGYLYTQIFTGTTLVMGVVFLVAARWAAVGWKWVKI